MRVIFLLVLVWAGIGPSLAADPELPQPLWQRVQQAVLIHRNAAEVETYLKQGFDPHSPIGCGSFDALDGAILIQDPQMTAVLLRYGAQPNSSSLPRAAFLSSPTAAMAIVTLLLNAGADVNSRNYFGGYGTALHAAVWRQNLDVVRLLLAQKAVALNEINGDGYSALAIAREKGNEAIASVLLTAGADPALGVRQRPCQACAMAAAGR